MAIVKRSAARGWTGTIKVFSGRRDQLFHQAFGLYDTTWPLMYTRLSLWRWHS